MTNILITGGTGFIGKRLIELFSRNNSMNLYVITRNEIDYKIFNENIKQIKYDGTFESLLSNLKNVKIDIIIHLATFFTTESKINVIEDLVDANIKFGLQLLCLSEELKITKFINLASYSQYSNGLSYSPQTLYSSTKEAFIKILEFYSQSKNIDVLNLYLSDTYGPNDNRNKFLNLLYKAINRGDDTFKMSPGEQEISYVYVDDVVNAIEISINNINHIENFGIKSFAVYGKILSLNNLCAEVKEILNSNISIDNSFYKYRENEIMNFKSFYTLLPGWVPNISLKEGIKKIQAYEKN